MISLQKLVGNFRNASTKVYLAPVDAGCQVILLVVIPIFLLAGQYCPNYLGLNVLVDIGVRSLTSLSLFRTL